MISWSCEVCGKIFPDEQIMVTKHDLSGFHNLPAGTMTRNVRHCLRAECREAAADLQQWKIEPKPPGR